MIILCHGLEGPILQKCQIPSYIFIQCKTNHKPNNTFFCQTDKAIITFTWKSRVKNIEDNLEKELQKENLLTDIKTSVNVY